MLLPPLSCPQPIHFGSHCCRRRDDQGGSAPFHHLSIHRSLCGRIEKYSVVVGAIVILAGAGKYILSPPILIFLIGGLGPSSLAGQSF